MEPQPEDTIIEVEEKLGQPGVKMVDGSWQQWIYYQRGLVVEFEDGKVTTLSHTEDTL